MTDLTPDDQELLPMYGFGIEGEGPSRLVDLRSIEDDLRAASRMFARVAEVEPNADGDLRRALYDSACIAYRRGFTSGKSLLTKGRSRTKVPDEVVEALEDDDRTAHAEILEHANTHVAHRVSGAEQARVVLILNNPQVGRAVAGVTSFSARFVGPKAEDALRDAAIATKLADSVADFVTEVSGKILASAQEHDLDSLYAKAAPLDGSPPDATC